MLYYNNVSNHPFIQSLLKEINKYLCESDVIRATEIKDDRHYLLIKDSATKRKAKINILGKDVEIEIFSKVSNIPKNIRTDYRTTFALKTKESADTKELGNIIGTELGTNSEYITSIINGKPSKIIYLEDQEEINETNVFSSRITSTSFHLHDHVILTLANGSLAKISYEELGKLKIANPNYIGQWYVKNSEGVDNIFPAAKFNAMFCKTKEESYKNRFQKCGCRRNYP